MKECADGQGMSLLPRSREETISWFEAHIEAWIEHADELGLDPAELDQFQHALEAARAAHLAAEEARAASQAATLLWHRAFDEATRPGRALIAAIKGRALNAGDGGGGVLLATALVDPPAPRRPLPAPATPANLRGQISLTGRLTLEWEATPSGPSSGIMFEVTRKRASDRAWTLVAATFDKQYTDPGFAAMAAAGGAGATVAYRVQARRGDKSSGFAGPVGIGFEVTGVEGGGERFNAVAA